MKVLTCCRCKKIKTCDEFSTFNGRKRGFSYSCKQCIREDYQRNKIKIIAQRKDYYLRNKEVCLKRKKKFYSENKYFKKAYSWKAKRIFVSPGKYFDLNNYEVELKKYNYKCAICMRDGTHHIKGLCVDHSHKTGMYRGILCAFCNCAIAHFKENTITMEKAIKYLREKGHETRNGLMVSEKVQRMALR